MKKTLYKGIDPNNGNMAYFIIQGDKVAPFSHPTSGMLDSLSEGIDFWEHYPKERASKVIEAIPTFELISEEDV